MPAVAANPPFAVRDITTPTGMARAHLWRPPGRPRSWAGSLVLGHGAGGGIEAADLQGLTALTGDGWRVVLVEQPWRVAGRRLATAPPSLDLAWLAVLAALADAGDLPGRLVIGGRSAGARVACRTSAQLHPAGVLALAFPLHPPGRPDRTRAPEALEVTGAGTRLAVIQGERDPFGTPAQVAAELGAGVEVFPVRGNHGFSADPSDAVAAARDWLGSVTSAASTGMCPT